MRGSINPQLAPGFGPVMQGGGGVVQGGGPTPEPDIDAAESWLSMATTQVADVNSKLSNAQSLVIQLGQPTQNSVEASDITADPLTNSTNANGPYYFFGWPGQQSTVPPSSMLNDGVMWIAASGALAALGKSVQVAYVGFSDQVATIRGLLEELRTARQSLAGLNAQVASLQSQVNDPNTGIASLQAQLASAQASVAVALKGCGS